MVLLDDNFASIVYAIRSGRRILTIFKKPCLIFLPYPRSDYWFGFIACILFFLAYFIDADDIVFMELIIDPVCSIAFESEQEEKAL